MLRQRLHRVALGALEIGKQRVRARIEEDRIVGDRRFRAAIRESSGQIASCRRRYSPSAPGLSCMAKPTRSTDMGASGGLFTRRPLRIVAGPVPAPARSRGYDDLCFQSKRLSKAQASIGKLSTLPPRRSARTPGTSPGMTAPACPPRGFPRGAGAEIKQASEVETLDVVLVEHIGRAEQHFAAVDDRRACRACPRRPTCRPPSACRRRRRA